jgi:hypothetical protein
MTLGSSPNLLIKHTPRDAGAFRSFLVRTSNSTAAPGIYRGLYMVPSADNAMVVACCSCLCRRTPNYGVLEAIHTHALSLALYLCLFTCRRERGALPHSRPSASGGQYTPWPRLRLRSAADQPVPGQAVGPRGAYSRLHWRRWRSDSLRDRLALDPIQPRHCRGDLQILALGIEREVGQAADQVAPTGRSAIGENEAPYPCRAPSLRHRWREPL